MEKAAGYIQVDRIVLDQQDIDTRQLFEAPQPFLGNDGDLGLEVHPERKMKSAAFPWLAGHPELAAHISYELAADAQTEAGAAVLSRRFGVHLGEAFEDQVKLVRRDTDARV